MPGLAAILLVGGILTVLALWLGRAARELSREQNDLNLADRQLALYKLLHAKARDGPEERRTLEQVELSCAIYRNAAEEYNRCVNKPGNRPVARLFHYRPVKAVQGGCMTYTCEDCGFVFTRILDVTQCPSCEETHLRTATVEEQATLQAQLKRQVHSESKERT